MMPDPTVPRWDMTAIFPAIDSPELALYFAGLKTDIADLQVHFDTHDIRKRSTATVDSTFASLFDDITARVNAIQQKVSTLFSYVGCFTSTDAKNERAQALQSELSTQYVALDQLFTRFVAWIGSSDVETLLTLSGIAEAHRFYLSKVVVMAAHQMSEAEESLASELRPSSISAWSRLHGNVSARLSAIVDSGAGESNLPISAVRALANNPDRKIRQAAFEAELQAWEATEVAMAASLNGVKGFQRVMRARRGYHDDLAPTLLTNNIDRPTLDAMHTVCVESFPDFHRYLRAKAHALGLERLAWYDMNAPLGATTETWTWAKATAFVEENFDRYSDKLADFAAGAFANNWIDAEPRVNKEGGAYCTGILPGVSRIMMNFDGSFNAISTLAHELGHAYHNVNLADRTPLQRSTPMTLAETASIFCETLVFDAAVECASESEKLALLDISLQRNLGVVVDVHSRFLFENSVFAKRAARDLTVAEFKALMTQAQKQTYGDVVEPLHPYMWAVKSHYYGATFYNYPYTFGLLFALGLYAIYKRDPETFRERYDTFLSSTGLADARTLAQTFDIDITRPDFWRSSLDIIRHEIAEFVRLVGAQ